MIDDTVNTCGRIDQYIHKSDSLGLCGRRSFTLLSLRNPRNANIFLATDACLCSNPYDPGRACQSRPSRAAALPRDPCHLSLAPHATCHPTDLYRKIHFCCNLAAGVDSSTICTTPRGCQLHCTSLVNGTSARHHMA